MAWHNLFIWANRTGDTIVIGCDECEDWERKLPLDEQVDEMVSISYLADFEDEHNEDVR
jgi:hypothetical protein